MGERGDPMKLALVVVGLLSSSCGLWPWGDVVCDEAELGGMRCEEVLAEARTQLVDVGDVTLLTVAAGIPCPVDEAVSCLAVPRGTVSTVYADLRDGTRIAVPVYRGDDGSLRARPAQDMGRTP
jgi:hypothetical protein